jgi:integrase
MRKVSLMTPSRSNLPYEPIIGPSQLLTLPVGGPLFFASDEPITSTQSSILADNEVIPEVFPKRGELGDAMLLSEQVAVEVGSVGDFVERYSLFRAALGLRDNTLVNQRYSLRWALRPYWNSPVESINASLIEDAFLRARTLSTGGTWANYVGQQVRLFIGWLLRREAISTDLSTCWPVVPEQYKRKKVALEETDYLALRSHSRMWVQLAIDILWYTGLRKGNILKMRWEWGSSDLQTFCIPQEEFKQGREHIQVIPEPLRQILLSIPRNGEYVLGRLYKGPSLNDALRAAAKRAGIDPEICYPHNFRASCCMRLREAGVPDAIVAQFMGWADTKIMNRYYVRPIPSTRLADSINSVS